ncbi:MAG: response regulator [Verrucomicrobia bacterium]|nr:response regulator [Verrucomicrobiota bacterium]
MENTLKIMAVDDEPSITESMRFIFGKPYYEVTGVNDSDDALARLTESASGYDVVITDQKMPFRSGLELVRELRKRNFSGKIMVLSAHLSDELREKYEQMDVHVMLDKPFNIHELRRALDSLAA